MSLFIPPTVRATDDNNNAISGAKWYFYLTGTTTLATVYTDDDLTTSATNPVVANGGGLFAPTYLDPAVIYRAILKDASGVQIQDIDPLSPDSLSALAADDGASLVKMQVDGGRTVSLLDLLGDESPMGALGPGVVRGINFDKRFTSATDDDTSAGLDYRNFVISTEISGANSAYEVIGLHLTPNFYHDDAAGAPNITFGYGIKQACRIGLADEKNGTLTTFRGIETHTAIEGTNTVTDLMNFNCGDFDWLNGTGTADNLFGFRCGNLTGDGGGARVNTLAACFYATDQTAGAPLSAAFYSNIASGTNKYTIYTGGSAPSVHSGKFRIGSNTPSPTDTLEVVGFVKAASNGNTLTAGSYHELQSDNSGQTATISNAHATAPKGLRINFSGGAPNNQTQTFLLCDDSSTTRFTVYSDGTVSAKGGLLSSSATLGIGYVTGAGGAAVQGTSKSTGVTKNTTCGKVTMNGSALAAGAKVSFTVTNSAIAATDVVVVSVASGGTANAYRANVTAVAAGSFAVTVENITGGSLSESPVINYAVIKSVIS